MQKLFATKPAYTSIKHEGVGNLAVSVGVDDCGWRRIGYRGGNHWLGACGDGRRRSVKEPAV